MKSGYCEEVKVALPNADALLQFLCLHCIYSDEE